MNRPPEGPQNCEALSEDLIEFALGTLSGRSRSLVLDHLESCPQCVAELESLATVADTMLWLAPEAEPPLGFETRLVERLREGDVHRATARRRRISVLAAAAVLVAALGFGVAAITTDRGNVTPPSATARPATGLLTSHGRALGQVSISSGNPSWMVMTVDAGTWTGVVWCEVTLSNGHTETVGKFTLASGYGSWVAPLKSSASQVRSARLVDSNGDVIASAILD